MRSGLNLHQRLRGCWPGNYTRYQPLPQSGAAAGGEVRASVRGWGSEATWGQACTQGCVAADDAAN